MVIFIYIYIYHMYNGVSLTCNFQNIRPFPSRHAFKLGFFLSGPCGFSHAMLILGSDKVRNIWSHQPNIASCIFIYWWLNIPCWLLVKIQNMYIQITYTVYIIILIILLYLYIYIYIYSYLYLCSLIIYLITYAYGWGTKIYHNMGQHIIPHRFFCQSH